MMRLPLAGMAVLMILAAGSPAASAELRTGSAPTRYPHPERSSPTRPELQRADVRYNDVAGSLQVTLTFYNSLADPASTSALRAWRLAVTLGDYVNGTCFGGDRSQLIVYGALADDTPAALDIGWDAVDDMAVAKTFNADRTQVLLAVSDPRLAGLGLICADARIADARTESSDTFAFLLDGFDGTDGALARELPDYLISEADTVARRLRPRRGAADLNARCREIRPAEFSCRASGPLRGVRGDATIRLRGRVTFDPRGALRQGPPPRGADQHGWQADMRATITWRHCPARWAPKALRGKRCHYTARWRGIRTLADTLLAA